MPEASFAAAPTLHANVIHDEFLKICPTIERHAKHVFRFLPAVDREESVAEAVAAAFQSFVSLRTRGKDPSQFPSVIATRAAQHVRNSRRVGSSINTRDVFCPRARQRHGFTLQRLSGDEGDWSEAVAYDQQTPIADQVSFRLDFPRWLQTLKERDRKIANLLAVGHSAKAMANRFGLSPGRISQLRVELRLDWLRFHGEIGQGQPNRVAVA